MVTKIRDAMTPNPIEVTMDTTIDKVAKQMKSAGVGSILVRGNGTLMGIVTDRDIAIRAVAAGKNPSKTKVGDITSTDLTVLSPDDPLEKAVQFARDQAVRRFPVVDGTKAVGIISLGDLAIEKDPESALAAISEAPANN